jgi:hypothetical protein
VVVAILAATLFVGANGGPLHAQSPTTGSTGTCDQFDSFCNYCANNAGSDLCQPGANPSMIAIALVSSGPMMGYGPVMSNSPMTMASTSSSNSTTSASTGTCDQYDSFCNYCANNAGSDLCQTGAMPAMNMPDASGEMMAYNSMSMGSMPASMMGVSDSMAGTSWVWCGAGWVTMPSPVWGWPC